MKSLPRPDPRADTKEYRDFWLPRFEEGAKEPTVWALKSSALMKAAHLLRPEIEGFITSIRKMHDCTADSAKERIANEAILHPGHDLSPIFMMLMAFAAENLLKGILIAREPDRVTPKKLSKWEGGGHDLIKLAEAAKMKLTEDETRLLLTLSVHGEWLGRYPCPLNHDERLPRPSNGGGFAPLGIIAHSDLDLAVTLCSKFEQVLYAERTSKKKRGRA